MTSRYQAQTQRITKSNYLRMVIKQPRQSPRKEVENPKTSDNSPLNKMKVQINNYFEIVYILNIKQIKSITILIFY